MHSDRVSMHASAHGVSHRHRPKVHVLVWHGNRSYAMASWSSSQAASVVEGVRGAYMIMARTGRYGCADGRVHGIYDGQARTRAV